MKNFKWRLQKVLDVKQKTEQIKKVELTEITSHLSATQGQLLMQKRILKNMLDELSAKSPIERINSQAIFMKRSEVNNMMIKELTEQAKTLQARQKEKLDELLKIRQFNQSLEKLRSQALTEFIHAQDKAEQKIVEDVTTYKFAKKAMTT